MSQKISSDKNIYIYEVNLTIKKSVFDKKKKWLINHFHEMVTKNNFLKLNLFFLKNTDPINDDHLRVQKIVAQYYIEGYDILQSYLDKQAKKMRSQVIDKLGGDYTATRRVLELIKVFENTV